MRGAFRLGLAAQEKRSPETDVKVQRPGPFRCKPRDAIVVQLRKSASLPQDGREPGRPEQSPPVAGKKRETDMKLSKSLLLAMALTLATSALAANKASLQISEPTQVSGTKLSPGEYNVQWEGTGPSVEMSILKGKSVVAKVPARLVDLDQASPSNATVVKKNDDGTRSLTQIRVSGKKYALAVGEDAAKAEATK